MAISQLQLPSYQVNNLVDQGQWNTLANLGTVYKDAQDAANKKAVLASLGDDPEANKATLLRSGDPALATMGINLQQKDIDRQREAERNAVADAHWKASFGLQAAAAERARQDWVKAGADEAAIPGLIASGAIPPQQRAPQVASPFPAPLPGPSPQSTVPPIPQTPSYIPPPQPTMPPPTAQPPVAPQASLALPPTAQPPAPYTTPPMPNTAQPPLPPFMQSPPPIPQQAAVEPPPVAPEPSAWQQTPRVPSELQPPAALVTPPVKAEGGDTNLPEWAQSAQASPPDLSITGRAVSNLTSPQPAAAAGISREQIGALIQNPLTRQLGVAMLQKQFDPGTYTFQQVGDKLVRTNSKTGTTDVVMEDTKPTKLSEGERLIQGGKDVTPALPEGAAASKVERENNARQQWARQNGYGKEAAAYYGATGKFPNEDLHPDERKKIGDLTNSAQVADRVLDNVKDLRISSKEAWGFSGAGPASLLAATVLPNSLANASGAVATQDLINAAHSNVANVAKTYFGSRISNLDVNLLKDLESSASQPDVVRQKIYDRAEKVFTKIAEQDRAEAEGIRNKTFFKPGGGGNQTATQPPPAPATSTAKPSLDEFMKAAREKNPGTPDADLARYWKKEYGS